MKQDRAKICSLVAGAVAAASLFAQQPAVTGTLTLEGKTHKLASACVFEEPNPFDKKNNRFMAVLWSDATRLGEGGCRDYASVLQSAAEKGGTVYVVAMLEQPALSWEGGSISSKTGETSFFVSSTEPATKFVPAGPIVAGAPTFNGTLLTTKPLDVAGVPKFEMNAKLANVKIERLAPITNEITGAAAASSPAAKAAIRFLTAMRKNDMPGVRAMIVEDERKTFDEQLASEDGKKMIEMMSSMAEDALQMPVASVATQGNIVLVTLEKKVDGGSQSARFKLRQENGEYRVTRKR